MSVSSLDVVINVIRRPDIGKILVESYKCKSGFFLYTRLFAHVVTDN